MWVACELSAFTTYIINPIIASFSSGKVGLGVEIRSGNAKTLVDFGSFIFAIIYFVIFIAAVYFLIVVPYKHVRAGGIRRPVAGQDLPRVPVQRSAGRRLQMQVLRYGPAHYRRSLTPPRCRWAGYESWPGYELRPAGPMSPVR